MGSINCISNQKGGAGKTSVTFNLGCVLAQEFKKRVLFVDVDGQANLTTAFGLNPDNIEKTFSELVVDKKAKPDDFILKTEIDNAFLIPSNQYTFSAEKKLFDLPAREFRITDILNQVRDDYDYIFLDTPPNLAIITFSALIASNNVILVYTASEFALDGLSQILNTLDEIGEESRLNVNNTKVIGAIQNRYRASTKVVNRKLKDELEGVTDIPLFFPSISDTTEIEKSQFEHKPITEFNSNHKVAEEFRTFAKEFIKHSK